MREAALIAAAVAAALPVAAKVRDAAVYHKEGPLRGSLLRNEPAPVYSTDPRDPWNRLFHLLYARKLRAQVGRVDGCGLVAQEGAPERALLVVDGGVSDLCCNRKGSRHSRRDEGRLAHALILKEAPSARCFSAPDRTATFSESRRFTAPESGPRFWGRFPMGSPIRLGRIAGIPVHLHFSFLVALT